MSEPWNLPEREVTPEKVVVSRRRWLKIGGVSGLALLVGGAAWWHWLRPGSDREVLASTSRRDAGLADLYPAGRNDRFAKVDRPLTEEAARRHATPTSTSSAPSSTSGTERRAVPAAAVDSRSDRPGGQAANLRHRRPGSGLPAGGARLPPPLRRGLGDGRPVDRLPAGRPAPKSRAVARRAVRPLRLLRQSRRGESASTTAPALALHRRADAGRGDERTGVHRHRDVRPPAAQAARGAAAAGGAVEVRLQERQVDREDRADRPANRPHSGTPSAPNEYDFPANVNPDVPHPRWQPALRVRCWAPTRCGRRRSTTATASGWRSSMYSPPAW